MKRKMTKLSARMLEDEAAALQRFNEASDNSMLTSTKQQQVKTNLNHKHLVIDRLYGNEHASKNLENHIFRTFLMLIIDLLLNCAI